MNLIEFPRETPDTDLAVLELTLRQLAPLEKYSKTELLQRGIPDEILQRSFPLYSFTSEKSYFGGSLVAQVVTQYGDLQERLNYEIPIADLEGLKKLGGIDLEIGILRRRRLYLQSKEMLPKGESIPVKFLNTLLWDVLHANFNHPITYEEVIELKPNYEQIPVEDTTDTVHRIDLTAEECVVYQSISPAEFILKLRHNHSDIQGLVKRAHIQALRELYDNNITFFAKEMQIGRSTVYRELYKFGIVLKDLCDSEREHNSLLSLRHELNDPLELVLRLYHQHPSTFQLVRIAYEGALQERKGSVSKLGNDLGTGRSTIYRNLSYLGISQEALERIKNPEQDSFSSQGEPLFPQKGQLSETFIDLDPLTSLEDLFFIGVKQEKNISLKTIMQKTEMSYEDVRRELLRGNLDLLTLGKGEDTELKIYEVELDAQEEVHKPKISKFMDEDTKTLGVSLVKRVAYSLARKLPPHVDVRDLISTGWIGFDDAYMKYDQTINNNFEIYAKIRLGERCLIL